MNLLTKFAEKLKQIQDNTRPIEEPELTFQIFLDGSEPIYESDGQFTAGLQTLVYAVKDQVYEFILDRDNNILEATTYPTKVSRFHKTNGIQNDQPF